MAFFGTPNSFVGIDIGTSSLKLVELTNRRRRVEVTSYAQTTFANPLVAQTIGEKVIQDTAAVINQMIDKAGITSDAVVAALPASAVFATVVTLPPIPEAEMEKAIHFAARDVVPAELEEVVLGYSRLGEEPHMATDVADETSAPATSKVRPDQPVPVFLTAAPKYLVNRYIALIQRLKLRLIALEVETFPLVRSLLSGPAASAMIVDMGDRTTTFHIIDAGTPRVSHTLEFGGHDITQAISQALACSLDAAEALKNSQGLALGKDQRQRPALEQAVTFQTDKAKSLLALYQQQAGGAITQTVLIGGGANLPGLADFWSKAVGSKTSLGNPWRGLSYPQTLEEKLRYLGPTYGVAVGLALRGFTARPKL